MPRHPQASSLCRKDSYTSVSFHVSYAYHVDKPSSSRRSASPAATPKRGKYNLRSSTQLDQPGLEPTTSASANHNAGKHSHRRGIVPTEVDKCDSVKIRHDEKPKCRNDAPSGVPSHSPTSTPNHAKSRAVARTSTIQDLNTRKILERFQKEEDEEEEKKSLRSRRTSPREAMLHRAPPIPRYNKARSLARISSESTICGGDPDCETGDSLGDDVNYSNLSRYRSLNAF